MEKKREGNRRKASVSGYVSLEQGNYILASDKRIPAIYVEKGDYAGVIRAAGDLCEDLCHVTGIKAQKISDLKRATIVIGTIGKSDIIDSYIQAGRIDASGIVGKWECFLLQIVDDTLVIVGSDKRGTIFGIYDLCEKIGVSPWKWWADVEPGYASALYLNLKETYLESEPSVRYRGIFINDEHSLDDWAMQRGDTELVDTYTHVYELLLRLKANMLWPAMHASSPPFHQNPVNAANADWYGIVIGTSHCEMLLRNNVSEYFTFEKRWEESHPEKTLYKMKLSDSPIPCAYVYVSTHPDTGEEVYNKQLLHDYWKESVELYGTYESMFTMGMRGLHDATWQPVKADTLEEKARLLEEIIGVQREILQEVLHKEPEEIPQLFIPYKEIQEIYDSGMRVPEDMTLMWTDDNFGYIRQLPTDDNRDRKGGAGIYYHVGYHGDPNSYIWLSTTPFALMREEMVKAYDYGADKIWILNVGDLKPAEGRIEYFMNLARNIDDMRQKDLSGYIVQKAMRDFGFEEKTASSFAEVELGFQKLVYARKPEHFMSGLFTLEAYGDEGQRYMERYQRLLEQSEALYRMLEEEDKPAYFQLHLYPLKSCCHIVEKYVYADKATLYYEQERGGVVNQLGAASDGAYYKLVLATKEYNSMLDGKWNLIMDPYQPYFNKRRALLSNILPKQQIGHMIFSKLGIAGEKNMCFSSYGRQERFLDIYNAGSNYIDWKVNYAPEWLQLSKQEGTVLAQERICLTIDWEKAPRQDIEDKLVLAGRESDKQYRMVEMVIRLHYQDPLELPQKVFVEADGYVSIEAEHYSRVNNQGDCSWCREQDLGREGDALKLYPNLTAIIEQPDKEHSAYASYDIYFESIGTFEVALYRIPTLNERGNVRIGIGLDEEKPEILYGTKAYVNNSDGIDGWGKGIYENTEILTTRITVKESGIHTLHLYQVDPGLVVDKLVIYTRDKELSYFGPKESYCS